MINVFFELNVQGETLQYVESGGRRNCHSRYDKSAVHDIRGL
jgi:hypothetical protein